ncbi:MAG: PilZ domain-containing protein, partial [Nevskia sp.]|nr:PilZ domain-containing protein [Nevskia sp.]
MAKSDDDDRRVNYRLFYPAHLRPKLSLGSETKDVLDISEWGLRFALGKGKRVAPGDRLFGTVRFRHAPSHSIIATVVRIGNHDVSARLEVGFDFRVIAEEHG